MQINTHVRCHPGPPLLDGYSNPDDDRVTDERGGPARSSHHLQRYWSGSDVATSVAGLSTDTAIPVRA